MSREAMPFGILARRVAAQLRRGVTEREAALFACGAAGPDAVGFALIRARELRAKYAGQKEYAESCIMLLRE